MQEYQFDAYPLYSGVWQKPETLFQEFCTLAAAKSYAGRLAKRIEGAVDIAVCDPTRSWSDRYITTAEQSDAHRSGYCHIRKV